MPACTRSPLSVRALRHPLELAAAFVAREAWWRGIPWNAVVRSAPQGMRMLPADMGAQHVGLFQQGCLVGYARITQRPRATAAGTADLMVLHPQLHHHHWLPEVFARHATCWVPGIPPFSIPWPADLHSERTMLLHARERGAEAVGH